MMFCLRIWQGFSAATTGAVEITLQVAIVAAVYIIGQSRGRSDSDPDS